MSDGLHNWFYIGTLIALIYVLSLRFGPQLKYSLNFEISVRAPLEVVRHTMFEMIDTEGKFGTKVLSCQIDPDDPDVKIYKCRARSGATYTVCNRTLEKTPRALRSRLDGLRLSESAPFTEFPFGREHFQLFELRESGESVIVRVECALQTRSVYFGTIGYRLAMKRCFNAIREFCETGDVRQRPWFSRGIFNVVSLLSVGVMIAAFGFPVGLTLIGALLVHELGHVIAFRLVGEQVIGVRMIPFLGAVALGSPPPTALRKAIVSLGGVVFSLLPIGLVATLISVGRLDVSGDPFDFAQASTGTLLLNVMQLAILVNLTQLVPVPMLDGGEVLNAAMSGLDRRIPVAVTAMLGVSTAAVVQYYHILPSGYSLIIGLVSLMSLTVLDQPTAPRRQATTAAKAGLILLLYGLTIVTYVAFFIWSDSARRAEPVDRPTSWWHSEEWHADRIRYDARQAQRAIFLRQPPCLTMCEPRDVLAIPVDHRPGPTYWELAPAYWEDTLLSDGEVPGPRICHGCQPASHVARWPNS